MAFLQVSEIWITEIGDYNMDKSARIRNTPSYLNGPTLTLVFSNKSRKGFEFLSKKEIKSEFTGIELNSKNCIECANNNDVCSKIPSSEILWTKFHTAR